MHSAAEGSLADFAVAPAQTAAPDNENGHYSFNTVADGVHAKNGREVPRRLRNARGALLEPRPQLRRNASRHVSLVHLYCAFGIAFLRGCYHQVHDAVLTVAHRPQSFSAFPLYRRASWGF